MTQFLRVNPGDIVIRWTDPLTGETFEMVPKLDLSYPDTIRATARCGRYTVEPKRSTR